MKRNSVTIGIAWLLYTASWFIQVVKDGTTLGQGRLPGWEAFLFALSPNFLGALGHGPVDHIFSAISISSALTNFFMVACPAILWSRFDRLNGALPWLCLSATVLNAWWFQCLGDLRAGYYLWFTSFFMLTVVCFHNRRTGAHARATAETQAI